MVEKKKAAAPKKKKASSEPKTTSSCEVFSIPEVCDITSASDVHKKLTNFLQDNKELQLEGSSVKKITTPGVQILLAACKSSNGKIKIINPSEVMERVFDDLGFAAKLNEWKD